VLTDSVHWSTNAMTPIIHMKRKIYIETSVISYLTARPSKNIIEAGHQQSTYLFWDRRNEFDLVESPRVSRRPVGLSQTDMTA
jgi:hypothetical protein